MRRSKGKNTLSGQFRKLKKSFPTEYNTIKIGLAFAIIFIPVMIWGAYLIGFRLFGIPTNIGAGDALLYWGSVLTFLGTVTLGAFAMAQNRKLNETNRLILVQQYKPILSISPYNLKIKTDILKVLIEFSEDEKGLLVSKGWRWLPDFIESTFNIKIENIGLGPALNIDMYLYQVDSIEGLLDLDNICNEPLYNLYEKIKISHYEYENVGKVHKKRMDLYTIYDLGINPTSSSVCFSIHFEKVERMHSLLELEYENSIGTKQFQYFYFGYYQGEAFYYPSSKVYDASKEHEIT